MKILELVEKNRKTIAVFGLMLIFSAIFVRNVKLDFPLIFKKDLLAHDESSNSVVEANITRRFFPPVVRVNPLNTEQGNWMEGPYWQHIPPMFAYVPYLFFKLDGQVTVEVKRLSFAFLTWLTGILFIFFVYRYKQSLLAALSATLAVVFWISTPFTHELITGYAFGASDIVLLFSIVCSFGSIIWYLRNEPELRLQYKWWKLILIGAVVALPIMAKNLLGAIPAATYFFLLLRDNFGAYRPNYKNIVYGFLGFITLLVLYYLPLFLSSPVTFKNEILVSFYHFKQLEGWGRPWHWYISNYLPQRYLFGWTWVYFVGLAIAVAANIYWWMQTKEGRKFRTTLLISFVWFVWNLAVVSLVTSKVPNFIYQTYLLSLFFIIYSILRLIKINVLKFSALFDTLKTSVNYLVVTVLLASIVLMGYETLRFAQQFKFFRAKAYDYQSEHEKFYQAAEELKKFDNINTDDLIIVRVSDNDCWFRYYPLFLTGTESKTLLEMYFNTIPLEELAKKYKRVFFVLPLDEPLPTGMNEQVKSSLTNYAVWTLGPDRFDFVLGYLLNTHSDDMQEDIKRIKEDKQSCQWLVPDSILNAP